MLMELSRERVPKLCGWSPHLSFVGPSGTAGPPQPSRPLGSERDSAALLLRTEICRQRGQGPAHGVSCPEPLPQARPSA